MKELKTFRKFLAEGSLEENIFDPKKNHHKGATKCSRCKARSC